jgi:sporulation protein YlmC with PRC-barrel domain
MGSAAQNRGLHMRLKELRGLPVIDPTAARKVGTVVDYQVDPVAGRIAALDVTPASSGDSERILGQRIRRVGSSAVILTARGGGMPSGSVEVNERWLDTSTTVGLEVMGDDGNRVGQLVDAIFDQDSLDIQAYLLSSPWPDFLSHGRSRIQPDKVHACSRELMLVATGRVEAFDAVEPEDAPSGVDSVPLKEADRVSAPTFDSAAPKPTPAPKSAPAPTFDSAPDGRHVATPT